MACPKAADGYCRIALPSTGTTLVGRCRLCGKRKRYVLDDVPGGKWRKKALAGTEKTRRGRAA